MENKLISEEKYLNKNEIKKHNKIFEYIIIILGILVIIAAVIMIYVTGDYYKFLLVTGGGMLIEIFGIVILIINNNFLKQLNYMLIKQKEDEKLLNEILKLGENEKVEIIKKLILSE